VAVSDEPKKITPIFVDDRQLQALATQAQAAVKDIYERLATLSALAAPTVRTMPIDEFTDLWWPLGEPPGYVSFGNFGNLRTTGDRLVPRASCGPSWGGILDPNCAALWGADATRGASGAAGFTGSSPPTGSLSAWVRMGDPGTTSRIVGGYFNSAGTIATMHFSVSSTGVPAFSVHTLAGTRTVTGLTSQRLSPGTWHFLAGAYNGQAVGLSLDGIDLSSGSLGAYAALNWGIASSPSWRLGLSGAATSWAGCIADLRMHSTVRNAAWAHEAWRRGMRLWEGT